MRERSVGPLVCKSVSFFGLLGSSCVTAPAQMLGLAFLITAPAHPHEFGSCVYDLVFHIHIQFMLSKANFLLISL